MPTLPPGLGTCNYYFDAVNGISLNGSYVSKWVDQSGYLFGDGKRNFYDQADPDYQPEYKTSSTVLRSTGVGAKYLQFAEDETMRGRSEHPGASEYLDPNFLVGSYTDASGVHHPYYDIYLIGSIEGTNQHTNNCWVMFQSQDGGDIGPNYVVHAFSNGQSRSGITMRATVGGYSCSHDLPSSLIGVDKWKLWHVSFSLTSVKIYRGKTLMQQASANLSNMPSGIFGHIGANESPNYGSGDGRSLIAAAIFSDLGANHTSQQASDFCDYWTGMFSGGSNGGNNLL